MLKRFHIFVSNNQLIKLMSTSQLGKGYFLKLIIYNRLYVFISPIFSVFSAHLFTECSPVSSSPSSDHLERSVPPPDNVMKCK
jgi:hypothetical protein